MGRPRATEILALLRAKEQTLLDAVHLIRATPATVLGGETLHRLRLLTARANWLAARLATARHLAALERQEPADPSEAEATSDE